MSISIQFKNVLKSILFYQKNTMLLLFLFLFNFSLFSQNRKDKILITLQLVDSLSKEKVPFVPVFVTQIGNDTLKMSFLTNSEGIANISVSKESATYLIKISGIFYKEKTLSVATLGVPVMLGSVFLVPTNEEMEGVEVTAKANKGSFGQINVAVSQMGLPSNLQTGKLLRMMPGVTASDDGFKVNGTKKAVFMLNGQLVDEQVITSLPSELIESIEIVANPPMSAILGGGDAIINIILKKTLTMYKGNIGGNVGFVYPTTAPFFSNVLSTPKLFVDLYFNYQNTQTPASSNTNRIRLSDGQKLLSQQNNSQNTVINSNSILTLQYEPSKTLVMGISGYFNFINIKQNQTLNTENIGFLPQNFDNSSLDKRLTYSASFNIKKAFTPKYELSFILSATKRDNEVENIGKQPNTQLFSQNNTNGERLVMRVVNKHKLKNSKLEYGFLVANNREKSLFNTRITTPVVSDSILRFNTGNTNLLQQTATAFISYSFKWKDIDIRLESKGTAIKNEIVGVNTNTINNFFPKITLSKKIKEQGSLTTSYGRSIELPNSNNVNAFTNLANPNVSNVGNNNIKPEITDNAELTYNTTKNYITSFTAALSYQGTQNKIFSAITQASTDSLLVRESINIDRYDLVGLNLSYSDVFDEIFTLNISGNTQYYHFTDGNERFNAFKNGFIFSGEIYASYDFKPTWTISADFSYTNVSVSYQTKATYNPAVGFYVQKTLLKEKLTIDIGISDIFNSNGFKSVVYDNNKYQQTGNSYQIARNITLNILYNFGKNFNKVARLDKI